MTITPPLMCLPKRSSTEVHHQKTFVASARDFQMGTRIVRTSRRWTASFRNGEQTWRKNCDVQNQRGEVDECTGRRNASYERREWLCDRQEKKGYESMKGLNGWKERLENDTRDLKVSVVLV